MIFEVFLSVFLLSVFFSGAEGCLSKSSESFEEHLKPYDKEREFLWIRNPFRG